MHENDAIETLTDLGLSMYEARTFVALQRLGSASASEVAEVCDVPRSQVYGAAEGLAERGLVDIQQGTPRRYRPVPLSEARERLLEPLAEAGEAAFDYLGSVRGDLAGDKRSEAIWIAEGSAGVIERARQLIEDAEEEVVYGAPPGPIEEELRDAIIAAVDRGVRVHVVTVDGVETVVPSQAIHHKLSGMSMAELPTGRSLVVDESAVLLSVRPADGVEDVGTETAVYSQETAFAQLFAAMMCGWLASMLDSFPTATG